MQAQSIRLGRGGGGGSVSLSITQPVVSLLAGQPGTGLHLVSQPGGEGGGGGVSLSIRKQEVEFVNQSAKWSVVSQSACQSYIHLMFYV